MKNFILSTIIALSAFTISSCSSPKGYLLPNQDDFQGYKIIDGVDKSNVSLKINKDEKIAVVVRDISSTAFTQLEPRYNNSMVKYDGKSNCCIPSSTMLGNSGNVVYKFSFIGEGTTTIKIISRQKGLLTTANSFESDQDFQIVLKID